MTEDANRSSAESLLAVHLKDSDSRCPHCRYSLRGCTADRCPECGTALRLAVVSGEVHAHWWHAAALGTAAASLLTMVVLAGLLQKVIRVLEEPQMAAIVRAGMAPTTDLPNWRAVIGITLLQVLMLTWLALILAARHRMNSWSPARRVMLGLAGLMSPAFVLVIIALMIRLG